MLSSKRSVVKERHIILTSWFLSESHAFRAMAMAGKRRRLGPSARRNVACESVKRRDPKAGAGLVSGHIPLELLPSPLVKNAHVCTQGREVIFGDGDAAAVISS